MDKEFMRGFLKRYYMNPYDEAIANSEEYIEKRELRYKAEEALEKILGGPKTAAYKIFDEYISTYADEMDVMLEEMYLLGARDREAMLR